MTIHGNTVAYFKKMAQAAKTLLERNYWNKRKAGAEDLQRQLEARAKTAAKHKQLEANRNAFKNLAAPKIRVKSMYPNGCIVSWDKPDGWEPDTYVVLAKDYGQKEWRSVASSNITWETRSQVLTNSYLAWGQPADRYEIAVAAVKNGVGRKESKTLLYPPFGDMVEKAVNDLPQTSEHKVQSKPINKPVEAPKPVNSAPEPQKVEQPSTVFMNREAEIIHYLRTYTGQRTRKGRPYLAPFRKHCNLYPKVRYSELRRLWKQLHNAPTGD